MPIEWDESLKTGIQIIDEQHQELIVMLNRIDRFRYGKDYFNEALAELEDFADTHFKTEEEFMVSINYPNYNDHKTCHNEFINKIINFKNKINSSQHLDELGTEIIEIAGNWIREHYSNEDIDLAKFIKNHFD